MDHLSRGDTEVLWLIGEGRSGTTWIANLLNYDRRYRELREPFHPFKVEAMRFLQLHQYIRPDEENMALYAIAEQVFRGELRHPKVDLDEPNYPYQGLLIKDIFANLFAYWVALRFSHIKIVLLMRNPFSVALSKQRKQQWIWLTNPMALLNQETLYTDYLHPFADLIRRMCEHNDYIVNQILIWAIVHYVPLCQFGVETLPIVFYEEVYLNPCAEIATLLGHNTLQLDETLVRQASRSTRKEDTIMRGASPLTSWQHELTAQQLDLGLQTLDAFGLAAVYDGSPMPNRQGLSKFQCTEPKSIAINRAS